jgi:intraflagellar transport protein 122
MEFDPLTGKLFSGSKGEFVLSSFEEKKLERHEYKGKILCCSWSPDGQHLAFGTFEGIVSIRNKEMNEIVFLNNFRYNLLENIEA